MKAFVLTIDNLCLVWKEKTLFVNIINIIISFVFGKFGNHAEFFLSNVAKPYPDVCSEITFIEAHFLL